MMAHAPSRKPARKPAGEPATKPATRKTATKKPVQRKPVAKAVPDHVPDHAPGHVDIAIIGGGIIGCSTAYYLAKRGVDVAVFEKSHGVAQEQSGRNWGFVRQLGRDPEELPLMVRSIALWQGLEKELATGLGWQQGGILAMTDKESGIPAYEQWQDAAKPFDVETQVLSGSQVRNLLPAMTRDWAGGIYVPNDGNADPEKVTHAFADAIRRKKGRVITNCAVLGVETKVGAVCGIATEKGFVSANTVVVAAGAWTSTVLSWLNIDLPQMRIRGTVGRTMPTTRVSDIAAWTPNLGFVQRKDGCFTFSGLDVSDFDVSLDAIKYAKYYLPAFMKHRDMVQLQFGHPFLLDLVGRIPGSDAMGDPLRRARISEPRPNKRKLKRNLEELRGLFDVTHDVQLKKAWGGHIEMTPDMLPVIDGSVGASGLIVVTGLSGHGFGIGPGVGSVVAELAAGETPSVNLNPFRLSRFAEGDWGEPYNLI